MIDRKEQRKEDSLRNVSFICKYTRHAEGSVLACFGDTKVLCTASIEEKVPPFLKGKKQGWVTAEYGMLPRSTHSRMLREAARGKQNGRTMEIQRLIARSLRSVVDLNLLGERTIIIDCDVIQADGGTRTTAINGGFIALVEAIRFLIENKKLKKNPLVGQVAAVSLGICNKEVLLDLDYDEDSSAETDINIVMNEDLSLIEIQGTAEEKSFSRNELNLLLDMAEKGIKTIMKEQRIALGLENDIK